MAHHLQLFLKNILTSLYLFSNLPLFTFNITYLLDWNNRLIRHNDEHMLAFIVKTKEGTIYHAGDLNDWYWDGEPKADNQRLTSAYRAEIRKIKGMHFDAAFVPLDPRQGDHYADGILYFLKNVDYTGIIPVMHWKNDIAIYIFKEIQDPIGIVISLPRI